MRNVKMIKETKRYRMDRIRELIAGSINGITIKEIAVDLGLPIESTRKYVKELLRNGYIYREKTGEHSGSHAYFWK